MKDFGDKLRVRASGHHSKCSVCVRHRLIIRRVGPGPWRVYQMGLYKKHLARQYHDRQIYWGHRAQSRLQSEGDLSEVSEITCIVDGMDQQKHAWPRSECMKSKEFNSWSRPRMGSTTAIFHGHCILVGLSPPNTPCSGSRTLELIAYGMSKPLHHIRWSNVFLNLEADNCGKEVKNQTCLRMLATMIASHRLRGAQLGFLSSGHSHEDIDAYFSIASAWLDRHKELHTIDEFQRSLQDFLSNRAVRPYERSREVVVFDRFHDWILYLVRIKLVFAFSPLTRYTIIILKSSFEIFDTPTYNQLNHQEMPLWLLLERCPPQRDWRSWRSSLFSIGKVSGYRIIHALTFCFKFPFPLIVPFILRLAPQDSAAKIWILAFGGKRAYQKVIQMWC